MTLAQEATEAHTVQMDSCTNVKKLTPGERRNYYLVYNQQVRNAYNQSPFLPEIGVRLAGRRKRKDDEPEVCCTACRLQCGLIWFAFIDLVCFDSTTFSPHALRVACIQILRLYFHPPEL